MNQAFIAKMSIAAVAALMVAGCATKSAPDFGGRWKPVNRFAATTTEIPLYSSYVYQASPMDGTLKAMLERWPRIRAHAGLPPQLGFHPVWRGLEDRYDQRSRP